MRTQLRAGLFFVAMLSLVPNLQAAVVCPLSFSGQFNGVYHYYCADYSAMGCGNPHDGASASPKNVGPCAANCDQLKFDAKAKQLKSKHTSGPQVTLGEHTTDIEKLDSYASADASDGMQWHLKPGDTVRGINDDRIFKVKVKGHNHFKYFRVMDFEYTPAAKETLRFSIGQEVTEADAVASSLSTVDAKGKMSSGTKYHHLIQKKGNNGVGIVGAEFFVISKNDFEYEP